MLSKKERDKYLSDIYYSPGRGGSYSGLQTFYEAVKTDRKYQIRRTDIACWLRRQTPYTLQVNAKRSFARNKFVVNDIDDVWTFDIKDMSQYAEENDGYKYALIGMDAFSRYVWGTPLKSKSTDTVTKSVKAIFDKTGRTPKIFLTDAGGEFKSKVMGDLLKKYNVTHVVSHNETKVSLVERVIYTLFKKMYRNMTAKNTHKWYDVLPPIIHSYNHTRHSSIEPYPLI